MAMMDSGGWTGGDQPMPQAAEDDFQFLDMGGMTTLGDGLQFDFQDFQNATVAGNAMMHHQHQHPHAHPPRDAIDTPMTGADPPSAVVQSNSSMHNHMPPMTSAASHPSIPSHMVPPPPPTATDAIVEIDAQIQYLQQQRLQQQQRQLEEQYYVRQARMVPPTPQSLDMQAGNAQYYHQPDAAPPQPHPQPPQQQAPQQQQQQQAVYERFPRLKDQQDMAAFTPLASPAVTPLETQFPVDGTQYVPGAYFSPLTSPALHAQNDGTQMYEQRHAMNATSSPVEMETDTPPSQNGPADLAKKARKNNAAKSRAKPNVRQSPISKPQKRKTAPTQAIASQILTELTEPAASNLMHHSQQLPGPTGLESENESVSPEALSDMPPPPLPQPRSAGPSPYVQPQNKGVAPSSNHQQQQQQARLAGKPSPATPASLMKLTSPNVSSSAPPNGHDRMASEHIESFELPPSVGFPAKSAGELPKLNTKSAASQKQAPSSATSTPSMTPHRSPLQQGVATPKAGGGSAFAALPSPLFAKPSLAASASQSPQLLPGGGGQSTGGSGTLTPVLGSTNTPASNPRKTPLLSARGSAAAGTSTPGSGSVGAAGAGSGGSGGGGKKRSSVGSVHVSPALRPKISPNIKPLLPGGAGMSAEDTASRLLTTKSNYQNILEGNTVPGVSYPSELSTNLTSKRTSHKIAEQGRRNRINSALQEIATLLPQSVVSSSGGSPGGSANEGATPGPAGGGPVAGAAGKSAGGGGANNGADGDGKAGSGGDSGGSAGAKKDAAKAAAAAAAVPNSKASTVELAIEYIKQLKKEVAEATKRAEEAEMKLGIHRQMHKEETME